MVSHTSPVERKRGRRMIVLTSSWTPWLLPFIALALLLMLRSSIAKFARQSAPQPVNDALAPISPKAPSRVSASSLATPVRLLGEGGTALGAAVRGLNTSRNTAAALPRAHRYEVRSHCSNTCFKAFDGVCDEGRPPSNITLVGPDDMRRRRRARGLRAMEVAKDVSELLCDLGTDCSDCGPWVGTVPDGWDDTVGPVSWLRKVHNATVFVRRTSTPKPFLAAITHHTADPDVSAMLWHYGAMEGGVTRVMHFALNGGCDGNAGDGARRRLVLDVGANFGYYTVQAALYGCRVVAFEPVRKFRAFLEWSIHAAGVAERVHVVDWALSDSEGPLPLVLPRDGSYWGLASIHGVNVMPREALETITVNATTLDRWELWAPPDAKPSDVILLKLDIEGWESHVLRGGARLLAHNVDNVLLEYSPGIYERNNMSDLGPQAILPASLLALTRSDFTLAHMPTFEFAAPWPPLPINPEEQLPPLDEITEATLNHDIKAIEYRHVMEVDPGGCPLPPELKNAFPVWRNCREWTYGVHPKGFRSTFGFNTNLWAVRSKAAARKHLKLKGVAALFEEVQDVRIWTSTSRPGIGIGLVNCTHIGAGHLQLFRCPCPPSAPPECAKERELVTRLAMEGKMPFTGIGQ